MARRITVPRIQRCNQSLRERQVRSPQLLVRALEVGRQTSLVLVQDEPSLGSQRRREEEWQCPRRHAPIGEHKQSDRRTIERNGGNNYREQLERRLTPRTIAS